VLALTDGGANGDLTLSVATNGITNTKLRESGACSVVGRSANSTGNPADISAPSDGAVLCRTGGAVVFSNSPRVQNLLLEDDDQSAFVSLKAPATVPVSFEFILPDTDGDAGQVLTSGGAGTTSWETPTAGSVSATTVEVSLGSALVWQGKFTITDAAISSTSKVLLWQAPGPYTGKGSALSADEGTMDPLLITAVIPATGSATVHWKHALGLRPVSFPNPSAAAGRVKGNFKFSYLIAA